MQAGAYISGGAVANTVSNNSVYLGYNTKALADGDTNEIVIGADATGAGSNSATLGNTSVTRTVLRGDVSIGAPTFTTGAAHNALVLADGTLPTGISNAAGIYAKDSGGTTELFSFDEAGNETQQTAHASDAPAWLYDAEDGVPMIVKEIQHFVGYVRYTNTTRQARLASLLDAEKALLSVEKRTCVFKETFAEHKVRTGITLVKQDWAATQTAIKSVKDAERQNIVANKALLETSVAELTAKKDKTEEDAKLLEEKQAQVAKVVIPAEYTKKPVPARIATALEAVAK
jgi:hypothetical protein